MSEGHDPTGGGAAAGAARLREERLLAFYDRLREKLQRAVAARTGERGAEWILLAPDLFILLVRLFLDRDVPGSSRAVVGGALAYFLLPTDLLPEAFLGMGGLLDDVVLTAAVLSEVFSADLAPFVERHWSGSGSVNAALREILAAGRSLLGMRLFDRLARVLERYGVELRAEDSPPSLGQEAEVRGGS